MTRFDKLVSAPFIILAVISPCQVWSFSSFSPSIGSTTAAQSTPRTRPLNAFVVDTTSTAAVIDTFFKTNPELAAFTVCSFKASAADILAQKQEDSSSENSGSSVDNNPKASSLSQNNALSSTFLGEGNQQQEDSSGNNPLSIAQGIDFQRNLGFLMYGGLYTGVAQHYLYNYVYPMLLGVDESPLLVLEKVLVDNLIAAPFLCLPVAYAFKAAFGTGDLSLNTMKDGVSQYIQAVKEQGLLFKYWSIWLPVQFLTFGVVPEQYRVPFVAMVSFFWMAILSTLSNADVAEGKQQQPSKSSV